MSTEQIRKQVERLTRYLVANPAVNLTIVGAEIIDRKGEEIARFANHLQAMTAIRSIREQLEARP